tara:strand:- start:392 stop:718 length:327 start_codon:yes stop_codon:yes gene_type:complete
MSEVKFTDAEMQEVKKLQSDYIGLQNTLGQIGIAKIRLDQQALEYQKAEDNIKEQFSEAQNKEKAFIQKINQKYGDGNLDITSGVFTPKTADVESTKDSKPTPEDLKK